MGRIVELSPSFLGLSRMVNVLSSVGVQERNDPDDVRVVQNLLHAITRTMSFAGQIGVPKVTGKFDAVTGFWIYWVQSMFGDVRAEVDGVISPAQNGATYGGVPWTISILNHHANHKNPTTYKRFLSAMGGGPTDPARRTFGFP